VALIHMISAALIHIEAWSETWRASLQTVCILKRAQFLFYVL
jgi:hypothetical protein